MLSNDEIESNIADLDNGWELKDGKIVKSFQFTSFMNAIEFVNEIARVAERLDHHPIITINWKTVKLSLKSFDVDAITKRDIGLAKEIQKVVFYLKLKINNIELATVRDRYNYLFRISFIITG
jgi:4a-hydroxytetrahydrobiopterin dehydratase